MPELPTDERVLNGVLAFMRWVSQHDVRFISSERLVYSVEYGYAGTLDCEAVVDGKTRVLDWKTNKPRKPKEGQENKPCPHGCPKLGCHGVYDEHRLQTAAYQAAAEEEGSRYDGNRLVVGLDKLTGDFSVHELDNYEEDAKAFRELLAVKKWLVKL